MPLIDVLKALASQVVLLHHLSAYGPLAEALRQLAPAMSAALFDYGRMAVQIFLVIAGFLAARGLSPQGEGLHEFPLPLLSRRYVRLALPFILAVSLSVVCSAIADQVLDDDMVPARAGLGQWLAHATLLHGVLGVESLSAGVWYVAIDFQLYALFALLLWLGRHRLVAPLLVLALAGAALFGFNRNPDLDNWGLYFFGSYGLGAAAWWASDRRRQLLWLGAITTVVIAALMIDFRLRIAIALVTALLLGFFRRSGALERGQAIFPLGLLGQVSYSVFLIHFPVLLLANAAFARWMPDSALLQGLALLVTWLLCIVAGLGFYRIAGHPAAMQRWLGALRLPTPSLAWLRRLATRLSRQQG